MHTVRERNQLLLQRIQQAMMMTRGRGAQGVKASMELGQGLRHRAPSCADRVGP